MAGTAVSKRPDHPPESATHATTIQLNKVVTDLETLRAAIVALATAAGQSASVSAISTAASLTAAQITHGNGVVIT